MIVIVVGVSGPGQESVQVGGSFLVWSIAFAGGGVLNYRGRTAHFGIFLDAVQVPFTSNKARKEEAVPSKGAFDFVFHIEGLVVIVQVRVVFRVLGIDGRGVVVLVVLVGGSRSNNLFLGFGPCPKGFLVTESPPQFRLKGIPIVPILTDRCRGYLQSF